MQRNNTINIIKNANETISPDTLQPLGREIKLHCVDGTITTNDKSLYGVINALADEEIFEKEEEEIHEDNKKKGNIIEKENTETGNVRNVIPFTISVPHQ